MKKEIEWNDTQRKWNKGRFIFIFFFNQQVA